MLLFLAGGDALATIWGTAARLEKAVQARDKETLNLARAPRGGSVRDILAHLPIAKSCLPSTSCPCGGSTIITSCVRSIRIDAAATRIPTMMRWRRWLFSAAVPRCQ